MPAITKASGRAGTIGSTTAVMTSETTAPIKGRRRITTRAWVTDGFTSVTSVTRLKMVTRTGLGDTKPTVDSIESGREWSIGVPLPDRKSTRLNSSHSQISYAVFCLKKKKSDKSHDR